MAGRIWDPFLTEQDRAASDLHPAPRKGVGSRPALLMVDLYRWVFGDEPQPLLEGMRTWPGSCGLAGWNALPHLQRVLAEARAAGIPVLHATGSATLPGWRSRTPRGANAAVPAVPADDAAAADRRRRRYDIVPEVAPIEGELVLEKIAPSAFWGTPLIGLLHGLGVDTVIVAGESTSGCVRATVVDARSYRFQVVIPEECVFDRHESTHAINLFDMDQKYADVTPLDEVVAYIRSMAG